MAEKKKTVWIFTELFYPDETSTAYIFTEIALYLSNEFDVRIVTENDTNSFGLRSKSSKDLSSLKLYRISNFRLDKNKLFHRVLKLFIISFKFLKFFISKVRRNDAVILVTNPAFGLLGFAFLNLFKKAKLILIVHDVFPENLVAAGLVKEGIFLKFLTFIFNKAYKVMDEIVVLGRDMKELVSQKVENKRSISIVENWADLENLKPLETAKYNSFDDKYINFLFAGNLGRLQNLVELVNEVAKFQDKISLTLIGTGAVEQEIKEILHLKKCKNILLLGALPREEQLLFLNSFDISIVSLNEKMFGLGTPSKTYNIIACGKPVLYIGPKNSEVDLLINENNLGWSLNSLKELSQFFKSISKNEISAINKDEIRGFAERKLSKEASLAKLLAIIQK